MRVLLVDDNADIRLMIRHQLEQKRSMEVVGEASDGAEALIKVRSLRPHVVIMDVKMPVMDGIEATKVIRRDFPEISVLAFSAYGDKETVDAMLEAGACGYVLKDAPDQELVLRLQDSVRETEQVSD